MKASEFNYEVSMPDSRYIVYNTYHNSMAILNKKEHSGLAHPNKISKIMANQLKDMKFLIDNDVDERKQMEEDTIKYANSDKDLVVRILTTNFCMCRCPYCYENLGHKTMDTDTADQVVEFIKNNLKGGEVRIEWFGGEPLCNKDIIPYICYKLDDYDINYTCSMVTNGILATPDVVKYFMLWNIKRVQITLDGHNERYEAIKHVSKGTYLKVIENIKNLIHHKIDVNIRLNLGEDNYKDLRKVILYMAFIMKNEENLDYLHFYVYPLFELCNDDKEFEPEIVHQLMDLQNLLLDKKLTDAEHLVELQYKRSRCFSTHSNCYTIGPTGKLYGCSHAMDEDIGNVWDGPNEKRKQFMVTIPERCKTCKLYPVCKGGCKVAELGLAKINQCTIYKKAFDSYLIRKANMILYNKNKSTLN